MSYLKYYSRERDKYEEHYKQRYLLPSDADKIVKKLLRHFKLDIKVYYNMKEGHGQACYSCIRLPKRNIPLGIICHEIGHHLAKKKTGKWGHNHKTEMKMKQVYRYCLRCRELNTYVINNSFDVVSTFQVYLKAYES